MTNSLKVTNRWDPGHCVSDLKMCVSSLCACFWLCVCLSLTHSAAEAGLNSSLPTFTSQVKLESYPVTPRDGYLLSSFLFKKKKFMYVYVCTCTCARAHIWRPEVKLWGSLYLTTMWVSRGQTPVVRLHQKHLYLLSHLPSAQLFQGFCAQVTLEKVEPFRIFRGC